MLRHKILVIVGSSLSMADDDFLHKWDNEDSLIIIYLLLVDSFVNSQEWTLARNVPDLRLGIVGALSSGKSALVHRYLTGTYMQEESPEGGRFKKEVSIDGQSHLLLIRDEGGKPELQVSFFLSGIIFQLPIVMHLLKFKETKTPHLYMGFRGTNLHSGVSLIFISCAAEQHYCFWSYFFLVNSVL